MCGVNVMDEVFRTGFGEACNQILTMKITRLICAFTILFFYIILKSGVIYHEYI